MGKRRNSQCGCKINSYWNNNEEPENRTVDRITYHGFGIQKEAMGKFNARSMFNAETQEWQRLVCNLERGEYDRYQVFGYIAATNGYK